MNQIQLTHIYHVLVSVLSKRASHGYVDRKFVVVAHTEPQAKEKVRVYMQENGLFPSTIRSSDGIWHCRLMGGKKQKTIV